MTRRCDGRKLRHAQARRLVLDTMPDAATFVAMLDADPVAT
jgi:hypothetical protein